MNALHICTRRGATQLHDGIGGESGANDIVLVPPFQLFLRRQRSLVCGEINCDITAGRYDCFDSQWPQRRHDLSGPRAPIETADERLLDLERVHQLDDIRGDYGLLTISHRVMRYEAPGAEAAHMRHDHSVANGRQLRDVDAAVDTVGPSVEQDCRRTVGRSGFGASDVESARIDLLDWAW